MFPSPNGHGWTCTSWPTSMPVTRPSTAPLLSSLCGSGRLSFVVVREREMERVTLTYSEQVIKEAVRSVWWRTIGPLFPAVSLLLAAFVIYRAIHGDRSWFIGVLGATVIIGAAVMIASYFVQLSRSLARLRRMKTPEATLELGEERFRVVSDVGAFEIQWSLIKQLWRFERAWVLLFSGSEFMTLPIDGLSEQSKEFIKDRAKANGAKIA
jgi:uncharacterized membrane protein YecN with MAPEG domain